MKTEIEIGEKLKHLSTGQSFLVKKMTGEFVIFQCLEDTKLQLMVTARSVRYLFEGPEEGQVRRTKCATSGF